MAKYPTGPVHATSVDGMDEISPVESGHCKCPRFPYKQDRWAQTVIMREGNMQKSAPITSSNDLCEWVKTQDSQPQEEMVALHLNNKNEIVAQSLISKGTPNETMVSPSIVYQPALLVNATRVVMVHNHPSGDSTPSPQDIATTRKVAKVGEEIGIPVLDHIVVGNRSGKTICSSLRDLGFIK